MDSEIICACRTSLVSITQQYNFALETSMIPLSRCTIELFVKKKKRWQGNDREATCTRKNTFKQI